MRRVLIVTLLIVAVTSCATTKKGGLQVRVNHDESADFSTWKTFRFATFQAEGGDGTRYRAVENQVREAIEENLTGRGYERIEDGAPDFRVAFEFATRGDQGSDPDRRYANDPTSPIRSTPTKTNTLIVNMLDPDTATVLWEGRVAGFSLDAIQHQAEIRNAVWRLFVEFPPIGR